MPRDESSLAGMRLTELLDEVRDRLTAVSRTQARVEQLLDAVMSVSSGLDLDTTLRQVVAAAADLVSARYGALGVLSPDGGLGAFITVGLSADEVNSMGPLPTGAGVLGLLIKDPHPLRITDLARDPASVGVPPGHPPMHTFLGAPITVRDIVYGNLYMTEKQGGGPFTTEDEAILVALAAAAGTAIDNARLFGEVEQRRRLLAAVGEVRWALQDGHGPAAALHLVVDRVVELTAADGAWLLVGSDREGWEVQAQAGTGLEQITGTRLQTATSPPLQAVVASGQVAVVDMQGLPYSGPNSHLAWGPTIGVPLVTGQAQEAVVVAARHAGRPAFDPGLGDLVAEFADQVGAALSTTAREQAARKIDLYADRDRIARDLHDHVIQRLFAAGLSLQASTAQVADEAVRRRLQRVVHQLDETVRDIRTTIFDLHTDEDATAAGLRRQVLDVTTETAGGAVVPTVRITGAADTLVVGPLAADVVAVVREGVSNAARHSGATHVTVTLDVADDVVVEVRDDGRGIPDGVPRSGLRNVLDRAERWGGSSTVTAVADGGTALRWQAPLPSPSAG